ncbi:hypothetical protein [Actinoplanes sp. NPDC051851]|uniref:hypothetical protein n=1 Tax=Actinoplanes sp. NPDC051851 TaxID=3154753 RepID=UPI003448648B
MTRRLALRRVDLEGAFCTLPAEVAEVLGERETVQVVLAHRVHGLTAGQVSFDARLEHVPEPRLTGLAWPDDVHPGVLVTLTWQPMKELVVLRTTPAEEPARVDGVDFFHEYDPATVTADYEDLRSNRGMVLTAVRRLGRVFEDGSALIPEEGLAARSGLGRGKKGTFLMRNAVDQLIREGYVTRVTGTLGAEGEPCYPAAEGDDPVEMLFYAPLVDPAAYPGEDDGEGGEHGPHREHWVTGFIRKLPPGAQPSEKQLSLHQQAIDSEQIEDGPLAPGYTFVKKHHRG